MEVQNKVRREIMSKENEVYNSYLGTGSSMILVYGVPNVSKFKHCHKYIYVAIHI